MRLCVETIIRTIITNRWKKQPPSCGCVLKHTHCGFNQLFRAQPPSCGCVLKRHNILQFRKAEMQPPSCGCVLKQLLPHTKGEWALAAAFVRLCVETISLSARSDRRQQPPSCGCVLKPTKRSGRHARGEQPPSCGCVLKSAFCRTSARN